MPGAMPQVADIVGGDIVGGHLTWPHQTMLTLLTLATTKHKLPAWLNTLWVNLRKHPSLI